MSGQQIEIKYFGKPFCFKILDLETSNVENCGTTGSNDIVDHLSTLNLSNGESVSPLHVSTPLKQHSVDVLRTPSARLDASSLSMRKTQVYMMTSKTLFDIVLNRKDNSVKRGSSETNSVNFQCIGGLKEQIQTIKDLTVLPLQNPNLFANSGEFFCKISNHIEGMFIYT